MANKFIFNIYFQHTVCGLYSCVVECVHCIHFKLPVATAHESDVVVDFKFWSFNLVPHRTGTSPPPPEAAQWRAHAEFMFCTFPRKHWKLYTHRKYTPLSIHAAECLRHTHTKHHISVSKIIECNFDGWWFCVSNSRISLYIYVSHSYVDYDCVWIKLNCERRREFNVCIWIVYKYDVFRKIMRLYTYSANWIIACPTGGGGVGGKILFKSVMREFFSLWDYFSFFLTMRCYAAWYVFSRITVPALYIVGFNVGSTNVWY